MRVKIGKALMVLGAALVLGALALFIWNQREARRAEQYVEEVLPQLYRQIDAAADTWTTQDSAPETGNETEASDLSLPVMEVDDNGYIGYLSIPDLGLELPVMDQWDYARLKLAPCRYAGSVREENLVIAAHNYARHFGMLDRLTTGAEVYFVNMEGKAFRYQVAEVTILAPDAIEEMTSGEYALTLFTCTYGGQSRVTVRCDRVEAEER